MRNASIALSLLLPAACASPAADDDGAADGSSSSTTAPGTGDTAGPTAGPTDGSDTGSPGCAPGTFPRANACLPCAEPGTFREQSIVVDGEARTFFVHVPADYDCTQPWPILVDLHGSAVGLAEEAYGLQAAVDTADAEGFILARPRSRSSNEGGTEVFRWDQNPGDPPRNALFIDAMMETIADNYFVADDRAYVMGFSSGTNQTAIAAADPDTVFDGFGFVGGGSWTPDGVAHPEARYYLNTGYRDYMHQYHRTLERHLAEAGVPDEQIFERKTDAGHDIYGWMYPDIWAFLDRGQRPAPSVSGGPALAVMSVPSTTDLLGIATHQGSAVAVGVDGTAVRMAAGARWQVVDVGGEPGPDPTAEVLGSVCFEPSGIGRAVGSRTQLETDDGGLTWTRASTPAWPGGLGLGFNHVNAIACTASGQIAVGDWMAAISDGPSWTPISMANLGATAQGASVVGSAWGTVVATGYFRYVGRVDATNASAGFERGELDGGLDWLYDVAPLQPDVWIGVSDGGAVLRSTDDARSFDVVDTEFDTDWYGVAARDENVAVAVGRRCAIAVTHDGGLTWSDASCDGDVYLADVAWSPDGRALIVGEAGTVLAFTP